MFPRRCVVAVRVPEAELRAVQSQHLAGLPGLRLETGPLRIELHRFDCLASAEDVRQVARAMDAAVAPCFDVLLSGLLFRPSPKKARMVVTAVKHGKKQLQVRRNVQTHSVVLRRQAMRSKLAGDYSLSKRFFFGSAFVPAVELGVFTAIDPANMLEANKQLTFVAEVVQFTARQVLLLDQVTDEVLHTLSLRDKV